MDMKTKKRSLPTVRILGVRGIAAVAVIAAAVISVRGATPLVMPRLSDDLLRLTAKGRTGVVRVILPGSASQVDALVARHGLRLLRRLGDGAVVQVSPAQLDALSRDSLVPSLSGDPLVTPDMSISNRSTAADRTRAGSAGLLGVGAIAGVTGQGIGVAVLDSGISPHSALAGKVVANVSFVTGDPSVADAFGHGTHVAGIIAGAGSAAREVTSAYAGGIAPGVHLVNVRVLGASGSGYTSDVIAGIDWVIANRTRYNIRVMNLSLGHAVNEPAASDPLCKAVERAYRAGIVVVASAGNAGQTPTGVPILGGITSPGNSPFAVTVGALNTWATSDRRDDTVAEYSSRGPTKYDHAVKPDLAAPGNRIVSLEAAGSYIANHYAIVHAAGAGSNAYMWLSGTSMSTPIVSGAVALLLQGAPQLGTAQVKLALQAGATYVPRGGLMGAGAGSLNIWASRNIAANGLSSVLSSALGATGMSFWDAGTLSNRLYQGWGVRLLSNLDLQPVFANPALLRFGDLNLVGLLNPLRVMAPNPLIWGEVATYPHFGDQIIWGTTMYSWSGDQIIWGTWGDDQIIWGTDVLTSPEAQ
jgi:serine protease AprX